VTNVTEPRQLAVDAQAIALDAVATHHVDGFRSGVARFNELLAQRLGVPLLELGRLEGAAPLAPLLSFKASELDAQGAGALGGWLAGADTWEVFLHEFAGLELERRLISGARRVHCGNDAIAEQVRGLAAAAQTVWTPGLILDDRPFPATELSVFSFGMAHKIRTDSFRRLKALLDASGRSYALYVSAANHETASLKDSEAVFDEMHEIFPESLYFLGNLSDVAVYNQLASATFFAAFFESGVRANNTSVASAMERGAVVITNLDRHSPPELVHMDNVIDVERCEQLPSDPDELARIGRRAVETAHGRDWDALVEALRP
jgi:hypothetical protein